MQAAFSGEWQQASLVLWQWQNSFPPIHNYIGGHCYSFYKTVRPWGFWNPVHKLVVADDPGFIGNKRFKLDMFNVLLGIVAQLCLTILPMYLILGFTMPLAL